MRLYSNVYAGTRYRYRANARITRYPSGILIGSEQKDFDGVILDFSRKLSDNELCEFQLRYIAEIAYLPEREKANNDLIRLRQIAQEMAAIASRMLARDATNRMAKRVYNTCAESVNHERETVGDEIALSYKDVFDGD